MKIDSYKIQTLIAKRGIKQYDLAKLIGNDKSNISRILRRGSCNPRTAVALANALEVDVSEITADRSFAVTKKICPLSIFSGDPVHCKNNCAWFISCDDSGDGVCACVLIARKGMVVCR